MEYTRTIPANYRLSLFFRKRIHDKIDRYATQREGINSDFTKKRNLFRLRSKESIVNLNTKSLVKFKLSDELL